MILLLTLGAILLSVLLQGIVRRGHGPDSSEAPASLRTSAHFLVIFGKWISIAPLLPLVIDAFAVRSFGELLILVVFLLVSLATILASWIWIRSVWKRSPSRSASAFAVGTSVANIAIALFLYRGLVSGDADAQDGIVIQIVPLLQLMVTAASVLLRRLMEQNSDATAPG